MSPHRGFAITLVGALSAAAVLAAPTVVAGSAAADTRPAVRINEVESSAGSPGDWIELYNSGATTASVGGFTLKDSDDTHAYRIPDGTEIAAGAYLVLDELSGGVGQFDFGLGGTDEVRLFDATGAQIDRRAWQAHAATTYGVRDGVPATFEATSAPTKGAANTFPSADAAPLVSATEKVVVNEIVYDKVSGVAADSIELYNAGTSAVNVGGWLVADDKRSEFGVVPPTTLAPGGFLVLRNGTDFPFGLGKGDEVVLYNGSGAIVDRYAYAGTAALATWARCPDGTGDWQPATAVTLGAANVCAATPEPGSIRINEIDSQPADWVEFYNPGETALDIAGYEIRDNADDHRWRFPAGASIAAKGYLVVDENSVGVVGSGTGTFSEPIGIGSADRIRLYDAGGTLIDDSLPWSGHAALGGDAAAATLARCPDGEGAFVLARPTPGATNSCVLPSVAINEIESNGDATDWVEIVNTGTAAVDLSGWTLMDNDPVGHAADVTPVAAGTTLAPGAVFVFDQNVHFTFGLGGADTVTIRDAAGRTVVEHAYSAHAAGVWARCGDVLVDVPTATKGAPNTCGTTPEEPGGPEEPGRTVGVWPGGATVTTVDTTPTFLEDSSGLDVQATADGAFLWAVDNGTGRFWKLRIASDGSTTVAPGWESGKRARFQKDAGSPSAAGPDAEGITVADDGFVYLASERDNSAKGVNRNVVLQIDPNAAGPDVVATREWDLTALLPAVGANLGVEAVEWIADTDLTGLVDATTGAAYDPARYPGHGNGLFFVGVEDTGGVYAFALKQDGSASLVATIASGLPAVMALDYDTVLGKLWAVCDDGCQGEAAQIRFDGTANAAIAYVARPAGLANTNNEGFATAPASLARDGVRPAWWFTDGVTSGALHRGTLPAPADPGDPTDPTHPTDPNDPSQPTPTNPGTGAGLPTTGVSPLPGEELTNAVRGAVTAPASARPGERVRIEVGSAFADTAVEVWMYSTPTRLATGTLDGAGRISVTIPADAPAGAHRLAVYATDGTLLGWTDIRIGAPGELAATGSAPAGAPAALGALLLLAGGVAVALKARRRTV